MIRRVVHRDIRAVGGDGRQRKRELSLFGNLNPEMDVIGGDEMQLLRKKLPLLISHLVGEKLLDLLHHRPWRIRSAAPFLPR